jgi:hypothetical protein
MFFCNLYPFHSHNPLLLLWIYFSNESSFFYHIIMIRRLFVMALLTASPELPFPGLAPQRRIHANNRDLMVKALSVLPLSLGGIAMVESTLAMPDCDPAHVDCQLSVKDWNDAISNWWIVNEHWIVAISNWWMPMED